MDHVEMSYTGGTGLPCKNRRRAIRRKNSVSKALRKQRIDREIHAGDAPDLRSPRYDNLHQFSKNKVHNSKLRYPRHHSYKPSTASDMRKMAAAEYSIKEAAA